MEDKTNLKKVIHTNAIIGSVRSRVDGSLSLNVSTPELTSTEKAHFMDLQNINVKLLIEPVEDVAPEELKIDRDLKQKSQSSRIRGVLFVIWDRSEKDEDFETFYRLETEKIIAELKIRLEDNI